MDRELIEEKLDSLRRCVRRVDEKRVSTVEDLEQDWDTQDILTVNLTRAVQLCVDVAAHLIAETDRPSPETMAEAFDHLQEMGVLSEELAHRLQGAVGFRNVAVHAYRSIDWTIVHSISHERLGDFRAFAHQVMRHLDLSSGS
ncbi:type VII toxin-antitoxin system HepT family RNase toxin [Salinibacter ruber]|uniref:type VII toxin-antitoxin system HepT family RNase toxin n=1 Tax=Salinibacter ruber TaxID=146919 RepID=UPI0023431AD7|nr:DUF86 domain-containing protein [Salinibacter ruber]